MPTSSPVAPLVGAFAVGFAIQRFMDVVEATYALANTSAEDAAANRKKAFLGWISMTLGAALGWFVPVLAALGYAPPRWVDILVTSLVVSGGTEWFNAVVKFLTYAKEQKKDEKETTKTELKLLRQSGLNRQLWARSAVVPAPVESFCMTRGTAARIVKTCIRAVGHLGSEVPIKNDQALSDCGIQVGPQVESLITMISVDKTDGVPSVGCSLPANALEAATDTEVGELVEQVFYHAR